MRDITPARLGATALPDQRSIELARSLRRVDISAALAHGEADKAAWAAWLAAPESMTWLPTTHPVRAAERAQ